ncbi:CLIP domain-containing serine protease 2 isoform X2 [Neodiprion lecontei]|nr:CLIP domain-containing serine protease 2-like isoform X2 [Neodiprion pinetum]XP_046601133.1 CLIP domain-containing serine protease 2 isoform X2 [Neodiprion lecontei]
MLLEHERCGNSNADRIIGGRNASLGTYPWLARIGYNEAPTNYSREKNELAYRCGGSLINKLYVVTAAHCVADLPVKLRVAGIRVGEHNTATDPDCENNFCGEPVQDFEPEQIVVHKDYNNPPFKNDIAIIRLNKPVNYSESSYGRQQPDCQTPRRVAGYCVEISRCPELVQLLQVRPQRPDTYDYLQQSQCGFQGRNPKVCCPAADGVATSTRPGGDQVNAGVGASNASTGSSNTATWDLSSNPHLPSTCGQDLTQRLVGGEKADIYEFPWMALLEYTKPSGRTTACGGVLISKRYVMTAAHCIKGKDLPSSWKLVGVRLGEYDTSTDVDCIQASETQRLCIDPAVTVGIEQQIVHEDYRPQSRDQTNDIALLRLSRDVAFTNYIRPICLPESTSLTERFFHIAGWGKTETRSESDVKLKLKVPLADTASCANTYQAASIRLGETQICAGGERGRDSCRGDSGGPLMSVKRSNDKLRWTAVGIVSLGPSPCGMENWPGIYTRVASFVPWILSKIRA